MTDRTPPALVALVGPTAGGKSAIAVEVARRRPTVEIVSVDSMQVYRGMDIGTAKPSPQERQEVRHHLVDIVDPWVEFTVVEFQRRFGQVRDDLRRRGAHGLLVGGTGLYHRAVIDGLSIPGQWPEIRAELEAEVGRVGTASLHGRLVELDPVAARRMEPSNTRRVLRALEVTLGSGRPFSSFGPGLDAYPVTDVVQIGVRWDRTVLRRRIAARVHAMVEQGFADEVRSLLPAGMSRTARQALGYPEMIAHVEGRIGLADAVEHITARTAQFAARQERWFRRDPRVRWTEISEDPVGDAVPAVLDALDSLGDHRPTST